MLRIIGDVHLGRTFKNGVPLDRRGEREAMLLAQFEQEMNMVDDGDIVCQIGDLFDRYVVPLYVIMQTAVIIRRAAEDHPRVSYIFIAGNHDLSRDADRVSAFEVLEQMLRSPKNILFVIDTSVRIGGYAFIPWSPFKTAQEMVEMLPPEERYEAILGHWDIDGFGKDLPNLIPTALLSTLTDKVYTGHVHKPQTFTRDGIEVDVVGSMQPLAHGEEAEPKMYLTISLEELEANSLDLSRCCVRILLKPGEVAPIPSEVGCLQLTVKREGVEEAEDIEVEFDDFDFEGLLREALGPSGIQEKVLGHYEQMRGDEHV